MPHRGRTARPSRRRAPGLAAGMLAAGLALAGPAHAASSCRLDQLAQLPLRMAGGKPLIDGEINGEKVAMVADTGSDSSAILRAAAARLNLHQMQLQGMRFYGVGGGTTPTYVDVRELKLGDMSGRDFPMLVVGESRFGAEGPVALIGADFWGRGDDEIDLAHGVIRLIRPTGCAGDQVIGYWGKSYSVTGLLTPPTSRTAYLVTVTVNGTALRAQLDTGSGRSFITRQGFYTLHMPWPPALSGGNGQEAGGLGRKRVATTVVRFDSFAFDQEKIAHPKIAVADLFGDDQEVQLGSRTRQDAAVFPDMILGADFFLAHRVMISNSQHKVYIAYTGGPVF